MAVAAETRRGPDQSVDRLSEFNTRFYEVLKIKPKRLDRRIQTLFPPETFESLENILVKSIELAEKVSGAWQPQNSNHHFRPDDELMVLGLLNFGVYAVQILTTTIPNMTGDIEEGILQVITRIRGGVETSNGRKYNLRTDRDRLRKRFTEELNRSSATNS